MESENIAHVTVVREMHLLGQAAINLAGVFSPEQSEQEQLDAVDATVALVNARMAPKMAS